MAYNILKIFVISWDMIKSWFGYSWLVKNLITIFKISVWRGVNKGGIVIL